MEVRRRDDGGRFVPGAPRDPSMATAPAADQDPWLDDLPRGGRRRDVAPPPVGLGGPARLENATLTVEIPSRPTLRSYDEDDVRAFLLRERTYQTYVISAGLPRVPLSLLIDESIIHGLGRWARVNGADIPLDPRIADGDGVEPHAVLAWQAEWEAAVRSLFERVTTASDDPLTQTEAEAIVRRNVRWNVGDGDKFRKVMGRFLTQWEWTVQTHGLSRTFEQDTKSKKDTTKFLTSLMYPAGWRALVDKEITSRRIRSRLYTVTYSSPQSN